MKIASMEYGKTVFHFIPCSDWEMPTVQKIKFSDRVTFDIELTTSRAVQMQSCTNVDVFLALQKQTVIQSK